MAPVNSGTSMMPPSVGVAFLVSQVGAHAAMAFAEQLSVLTLKPYDAGILRILGSNPGITQQALSRGLGMFPSRLVALLDDLERQKLIARRESPSDRRIYQLHLTEAGTAALIEIGRLTVELEDKLFAALTAEEKEFLGSLLARIVAQQQITPSVHPAYRQISTGEVTVSARERTMQQTFTTRLRKDSNKNVTGIVVPPEVMSALSTSKKPAVKVTVNGYTYRSTVAVMGGEFMISLSSENRKAAGLKGDEELEVKLELDTEPRTVEIPSDLRAALSKGNLLDAFEKVAPSGRKEFVRQVAEAKTAETRKRRIEKIVEALQP